MSMKWGSAIASAALAFLCAAQTQAQTQPPAPAAPGREASVKERRAYWDVTPLAPAKPPPGFERKPPLSDRDRRAKRSQKPFAVIGVPQLGGNPDFGFIVGVVSALTWYGEPGDEPYYDYSPFKQRILMQAQVGLRRKPNILGRQNHIIRYEAPYIARSKVSLTVDASYLEDRSAWYFGNDARTMGSLGQIGPFSGQSFDTFNAYQEQLREVRDTPMGKRTYAVYHNYKVIQPRLLGIAKIDLLGGIVRPAATLNLSKVFVERYGGSSVRGVDETGISEPTKLDEDCAAGLVTSCDGDWANTIKLSLTLDTRDFPTDPDSGALLDVSYETGKGFLGTPNFDRLTSTGSVYVSPFQWFGLDNRYTQLTFAARVIYSVITSDAPFWLKNQLSFSESTGLGLGGIFTLRGYRLNRFVGNVMAVGNLEARYDVYSFNTKRSTITFKIVPHFDAGRVFDRVADTRLSGFRYNGGGGLYLQWNQSNIIRADVGFGDEGSSFGVNFGMMY